MNTALENNEPSDLEWDLYESFTDTFDAWHNQMGHPIVFVNADNGVLK